MLPLLPAELIVLMSPMQLASLVKAVIASILNLPEVNANIKLALVELQEVDYTLKNIHAKVKFLPGHVNEQTCFRRFTQEKQLIRQTEKQVSELQHRLC